MTPTARNQSFRFLHFVQLPCRCRLPNRHLHARLFHPLRPELDQAGWPTYFPGMTIHVNIGEAKTRLSQLIAAALRGEEVVVDNDGRPQVRLVAVPEATDAERERMIAKRRAAVGKWAKDFEN
jgi:antitoxin (DNA-binding transcriptional repressor) of toxin-antitoxin stability system